MPIHKITEQGFVAWNYILFLKAFLSYVCWIYFSFFFLMSYHRYHINSIWYLFNLFNCNLNERVSLRRSYRRYRVCPWMYDCILYVYMIYSYNLLRRLINFTLSMNFRWNKLFCMFCYVFLLYAFIFISILKLFLFLVKCMPIAHETLLLDIQIKYINY